MIYLFVFCFGCMTVIMCPGLPFCFKLFSIHANDHISLDFALNFYCSCSQHSCWFYSTAIKTMLNWGRWNDSRIKTTFDFDNQCAFYYFFSHFSHNIHFWVIECQWKVAGDNKWVWWFSFKSADVNYCPQQTFIYSHRHLIIRVIKHGTNEKQKERTYQIRRKTVIN